MCPAHVEGEKPWPPSPNMGVGEWPPRGAWSLADWGWSKFLVDMKTREGSVSSWVGCWGV